MSTTQSPTRSASPTTTRVVGSPLRVSAYDQVSGLLISLLMLLGFCVLVMFAVWLTSYVWVRKPPTAVTWLEEPEPGGGGTGGPVEEQLDQPKEEEIEVLDPPTEMVLESITDVVSTQPIVLDNVRPQFRGQGQGRGTGDGRGVGPGGPGTADIIPRWERWDIRYSVNSIELYASQLDSFKIELGAVGGGSATIDYAAGFSGSTTKRSGTAADEKRLYFTWKDPKAVEADVQLLTRAGVSTKGRIVMQFYSAEIENQLAVMEKERLGGDGDVRRIRRTVFGVRPKGSAFEYYVVDQTYRTFIQ